MPEPIDWTLLSFDGNRRAQHVAFMALTFREKIVRLEQMAEVQRRVTEAVAVARTKSVDQPPKHTRE